MTAQSYPKPQNTRERKNTKRLNAGSVLEPEDMLFFMFLHVLTVSTIAAASALESSLDNPQEPSDRAFCSTLLTGLGVQTRISTMQFWNRAPTPGASLHFDSFQVSTDPASRDAFRILKSSCQEAEFAARTVDDMAI